MLTKRTIETFLRSVAANCTDAQYESLAKAFVEVPGLATVASAADLQIKASIRRRIIRDIEVAEHKAIRIDKTIEGKYRAIDSSESNIRHCNESISKSKNIIEHKRSQIYDLQEQHNRMLDAKHNSVTALEEFDRKYPDAKAIIYVPRKSYSRGPCKLETSKGEMAHA